MTVADDLVPLPWSPKPKPPPRLTIWQLKDHHCKWPFGSVPPFRFCGLERVEGRPYCAEHTRMAYRREARR